MFQTNVVQKIKTRILFSIPFYNLGVTFDGNSRSMCEHSKHLAVATHHVRAGFALLYAALPAPPSSTSNWHIFPKFSWPHFVRTPTEVWLVFCEKILSAPPFYLSADCELPNERKPEREVVTLTTVVAVPHYKTIHNRMVSEKVKQTVSPFEKTLPIALLSRLWSKRSTPPIIALYFANAAG
jgi:hypothetical protein